ncbi:hypothetical protein PMAYCL1PPCAC_25624, partial [Pristionchus mayeri]
DCSPEGYCICSSSHCSPPFDPPSISELHHGQALLYSTSLSGDRLAKSRLVVMRRRQKWINGAPEASSAVKFSIFPSEHRQTIIGFGGALTDSTVLNINNLTEHLQRKLMESYFGADGIGYSIVRIPIASCDFATHEYSYDDKEGDFDLRSFALVPEDALKIKWARRAMELVEMEGRELKVLASPWSAPSWMKTSGQLIGAGELKNGSEYSRTWANYLAKFIDLYSAQGVPIWALTVQNQPSVGNWSDIPFQNMYMSPQMEAKFVRDFLKPALLSSSGGRNVSVVIHDDFRPHLPDWPDITLSEPGVEPLVDGIAVHWYLDKDVDPERLSLTKERHPRQFLLGTEACVTDTKGPRLGNFTRAVLYARDIIQDLTHSVSGWMDWNLALDLKGGPNWVGNNAD